jgi:hypothetical protein
MSNGGGPVSVANGGEVSANAACRRLHLTLGSGWGAETAP